jgi:hypothetical protein
MYIINSDNWGTVALAAPMSRTLLSSPPRWAALSRRSIFTMSTSKLFPGSTSRWKPRWQDLKSSYCRTHIPRAPALRIHHLTPLPCTPRAAPLTDLSPEHLAAGHGFFDRALESDVSCAQRCGRGAIASAGISAPRCRCVGRVRGSAAALQQNTGELWCDCTAAGGNVRCRDRV